MMLRKKPLARTHSITFLQKTQETVEVSVFRKKQIPVETIIHSVSLLWAPAFAPEFQGPYTTAKQANWNLNALTVCLHNATGSLMAKANVVNNALVRS